MRASVFLSCQKPYLKCQKDFLECLKDDLKARCLLPRTVGVTDYDMRAPLSTIRSLMLDCNGLIAIAFRRHYIEKGAERPNSNIKEKGKLIESKKITKEWFTTPWCQIEPAMAFQIGLPVLIFRESGVRAEGILEKGVFGTYMPEFDLSRNMKAYFSDKEYLQIIQSWESKVWQVVGRKGNPRKLYDE